jgi:siroheme synthase-like protein
MSFYPVFLNLRGRLAVVVGGGAIAEQKVTGLLEAGARVIVTSPELTWKLEDLAATGAIDVQRRPYRRGDLEGAFIAIAAHKDYAESSSAAPGWPRFEVP